MTAIQITDAVGVVQIAGETTLTVAQQAAHGHADLADGDNANLASDSIVGDAVLDFTDPTVPVVLVDGLHIFSVYAEAGQNPGKSWVIELASTFTGVPPPIHGGWLFQSGSLDPAILSVDSFLSATLACKCLAGDIFHVKVLHDVGAPITVRAFLEVVRL